MRVAYRALDKALRSRDRAYGIEYLTQFLQRRCRNRFVAAGCLHLYLGLPNTLQIS